MNFFQVFMFGVIWMPQLESLKFLPRAPVQNPVANSLQTSNAPSINPIRPKPVNCSYSQNAPFDKMKTRHRFSPLGGAKRVIFSVWHLH